MSKPRKHEISNTANQVVAKRKSFTPIAVFLPCNSKDFRPTYNVFNLHSLTRNCFVVCFPLLVTHILCVFCMSVWEPYVLMLFLYPSISAIRKHQYFLGYFHGFFVYCPIVCFSVVIFCTQYSFCSSVYYYLDFYCVPFFLPE